MVLFNLLIHFNSYMIQYFYFNENLINFNLMLNKQNNFLLFYDKTFHRSLLVNNLYLKIKVIQMAIKLIKIHHYVNEVFNQIDLMYMYLNKFLMEEIHLKSMKMIIKNLVVIYQFIHFF